MWFCPDCRRGFSRRNQSHECAPAISLDEYLATAPAWEPGIITALLDHLRALGPIHVEPVAVGVFFKSDGSFVELRTMTRWSRLWIPLPRVVKHPRLRVRARSESRIHHTVDLDHVDQVDESVRAWLSEGYAAFG